LKLKIYTTARSGYPEVPDLKRNVICALNVKWRKVRRYAAIAFGPLLASVMSINGSDVHWLMGLSFPSLTYRMLGRKPIVLDIDDPDFSKPPHPLLFDGRVVKVVVPTSQIREGMARLYRIRSKDIEVVPNGVDVNLFRPTPIPSEKKVLYYGTLEPHRSSLLIKVIEEVCKRDKEVKFIVVGGAPTWLKAHLNSAGLRDRVALPGFVPHDELPRWLERARVCLLPQHRSLGRGGSLKLLEYMSSGRPVVATDVDESYPVKEAGAGLVVPVDPEAVAEAVLKVLSDEPLAERLAARGVEYARKFTWEKSVDRYVEVFNEVVEGS